MYAWARDYFHILLQLHNLSLKFFLHFWSSFTIPHDYFFHSAPPPSSVCCLMLANTCPPYLNVLLFLSILRSRKENEPLCHIIFTPYGNRSELIVYALITVFLNRLPEVFMSAACWNFSPTESTHRWHFLRFSVGDYKCCGKKKNRFHGFFMHFSQ